MSKGKQAFTKSEVARAIRATQDQKLPISSIRITRDEILIKTGQEEPANALDRELQEFERRHGSH
jgi:hypothetical protein